MRFNKILVIFSLVITVAFSGIGYADYNNTNQSAKTQSATQSKASVSSTTAVQAKPIPMLQGVTNKLIIILKNRHRLSQDQFSNAIFKVLHPHIDVDYMSRLVLARYWRDANKQQRIDFGNVLLKRVICTYTSALQSYSSEQIKYLPIRGGVSQNTSRVTVNSMIQRPNGPPVRVSFRLIKNNNEWLVYDMSVEGIGLVSSLRSQVGAALSQGQTVSEVSKRFNPGENC